MILTATPASANDAQRLAGLGAQLVASATRPRARMPGGQASRRPRRRARGSAAGVGMGRHEQDAQAALGPARPRPRRARPSRRARRRRPVARDGRRNVGAPRATIPGSAVAAIGERDRAPLPGRRERHLARPAPRLAAASGRRSPRSSGCGRSPTAASAASAATTSSSEAPSSPVDRLDLEPVRGQRAGLVEAQDVDVAQRLDRVRLLDQRPEAQDPDRAEGVGDGDRHEQAVGHEAGEQRRVGDDVAQRPPPARRRGGRAGSRGRCTMPSTTRMTRLISAWSGVITRRNDRAPAVIRLAKLPDATVSAT